MLEGGLAAAPARCAALADERDLMMTVVSRGERSAEERGALLDAVSSALALQKEAAGAARALAVLAPAREARVSAALGAAEARVASLEAGLGAARAAAHAQVEAMQARLEERAEEGAAAELLAYWQASSDGQLHLCPPFFFFFFHSCTLRKRLLDRQRVRVPRPPPHLGASTTMTRLGLTFALAAILAVSYAHGALLPCCVTLHAASGGQPAATRFSGMLHPSPTEPSSPLLQAP